MAVEIKIPSIGESITEVVVAQWFKKDGESVDRDEAVLEIETDKINQEIVSPEAGVLRIVAQEGDTLAVGDVAGHVEPGNGQAAAKPSTPAAAGKSDGAGQPPSPEPAPKTETGEESEVRATSVARKVAAEYGVDLAEVPGHGAGGRVTKDDVLSYAEQKKASPPPAQAPAPKAEPAKAPESSAPSKPRPAAGTRETSRERVTSLRKRVAQRLVQAQSTAAILTTFNEVDMTAVMDIRRKYKEPFKERHGVGLGFMSFFVRACVQALEEFPRVNAYLEEDEIVYHHYCDIGIAVGSDRGLVVPVIRNVESMSFAEIESAIRDYARKAQGGELTMDDLTGGTFTISNGGVYGSMMSTPILNPPQSGILGMHNIVERPMAINGEVKIRPMMYLALSYDHRMIDGKEAVSFLVRVKECIEAPERLLVGV